MTNPNDKRNIRKRPSPVSRSTAIPLVMASVVFVMMFGLLALLWLQPDRLPPALTEKYWFVIAMLLGFFCSVSLFALFRSYGRYSGNILNGKVELGGPGVLMLVIVALAFVLPPEPQRFDFAVFLGLPDAVQGSELPRAKIFLQLGADKRIEPVDSKGAARFIGIPAEWRGKQVTVGIESATLQLAAPEAGSVALTGDMANLPVSYKPWRFSGLVLDSNGQPVSGAHITVETQQARTDTAGRFAITLSMRNPEQMRELLIQHPKYALWRNAITPGVETMQIQLQPQ